MQNERDTPESSSKIDEVSELLRRLCVADNNVALFSLDHPVAAKAVEDAHGWIAQMIERRAGPVILNLAEDKILFEGLPVEMRNPQVQRLFNRISKLRVNNIHFLPGLTIEEFKEFHGILQLKPEDVERAGGPRAVWEEKGLTHIDTSTASYVMVDDEHRVVSRHAQIVEGQEVSTEAADESMLKSTLTEVLQKSGDREWLVQKAKNNPKDLAALILRGLEKATAESEGPEAGEVAIESLLDNIRLVGGSLMDDNEQIKDGEEDLKDSVLELEKEIRARSEHMMSSAASRRFISEILNVVTSFSDRVKAYRIAETFVQDETSLKKTEQLIKNLAAGSEAGDKMLIRLRNEITSRGLGEEDIKKLLDKTKPKPKAKRRRKKTFDKALSDGIRQRVRSLGLEGEKHNEAIERLTTFFENKLKEREADFNREKKRLTTLVAKRDQFIDEIAKSGVVIWDVEGKVEYSNIFAADLLELKPGDLIRKEVLDEISESNFPLEQVNAEALEKVGLSKQESRLLIEIDTVVTDEAGRAVGILTRGR